MSKTENPARSKNQIVINDSSSIRLFQQAFHLNLLQPNGPKTYLSKAHSQVSLQCSLHLNFLKKKKYTPSIIKKQC